MSRTAAHDGGTPGGRAKRWGAAVASVALLATGLVMVPGTASANGDCPSYWEANGGWSGRPAAGGTGTAQDPYKVGDEWDLNEIRWCPDAHFVQIADVALTQEWEPIIGEGRASGNPFTGVYDGAGRTISGLTIARPNEDHVGLFREVSGEGRVTDAALTGVAVTGRDHTAALAGSMGDQAKVSRVSVAGSVTGRDYVGGLAASLIDQAEVSEVSVTGTVTGNDYVGGLVAFESGPRSRSVASAAPTITDVSASATVTGQRWVGGVVGESLSATISKAAVSGTLSGTHYVGGIVGSGATATIHDVATDVSVTASVHSAGGVAGELYEESTLSDSAAAGSVQAGSAAGGLVGRLEGTSTVRDSAADVNVTGTAAIGGLVGRSWEYPTIRDSVAAGTVSGDYAVGGLLGDHVFGAVTIMDSAASGAVSGTERVGGLAGIVVGSVKRSSASGSVRAGGDEAGGLVGAVIPGYGVCASAVCAATPAPQIPTEIRQSFATGDVTGRSRVGGLVGLLADNPVCPVSEQVQVCAAADDRSGTIYDSYSTGSVMALDVAGGLVGSTGSLQIGSLDDVRVLEEPVDLSVVNTYNSGEVSGITRGGVLGEDPGNATVVESFWDATANPGLTGAKGSGKTQDQLRDITTFTRAQWAIQAGAPATGGNVWGICVPPDAAVHNGYPFLLWQHTTTNPCHPVPQAPVLKSLTPGNGTLGVTAELRDDGGNPVTKVQYRLDGGEWIDSGGATGSFTIAGLTNGKTYKVHVRAINKIGASEPSNELSGTPTAVIPPTPPTVLKVNGLDKGDQLPVDERSLLVRSVRTNGQIVVARVFCTLKGNRLPPRLRDRLCGPTVSGPAATATGSDVSAAAKTRKKKLRITAKPNCSAGLRVHVKIAAKATGSSRKVFTRTFRVDNKPSVKCRLKGTG